MQVVDGTPRAQFPTYETKLKFLRGASNLDIYAIRTNKTTKLAQVKYTGLPACVLYKLFCQAKQILALTQIDMQTTHSVHEPTLTIYNIWKKYAIIFLAEKLTHICVARIGHKKMQVLAVENTQGGPWIWMRRWMYATWLKPWVYV